MLLMLLLLLLLVRVSSFYSASPVTGTTVPGSSHTYTRTHIQAHTQTHLRVHARQYRCKLPFSVLTSAYSPLLLTLRKRLPRHSTSTSFRPTVGARKGNNWFRELSKQLGATHWSGQLASKEAEKNSVGWRLTCDWEGKGERDMRWVCR